jgi:hypothetical protein
VLSIVGLQDHRDSAAEVGGLVGHGAPSAGSTLKTGRIVVEQTKLFEPLQAGVATRGDFVTAGEKGSGIVPVETGGDESDEGWSHVRHVGKTTDPIKLFHIITVK